MVDWNAFNNYMISVWSWPPLRYMTMAMILGYIGLLAIQYKREKSQNYILIDLYYHPAWICYGAYHLIFSIYVFVIMNGLGLVPEEGYGKILGPVFMILFFPISTFLERLGHNLICWYLGTPLWPWNPFADKLGFDKIVAQNQRENRKTWAAAERKKRSEGKRFSDE